MNTINTSQQANWENNVYILSTTRVLMAVGVTFLIRSIYQLCQSMRSVGSNARGSVADAGAVGVDLEALALGAIGDAPMFSSEPVGGVNETLDITLPQPTYSPQARTSRYPVASRQQLQHPEALTTT